MKQYIGGMKKYLIELVVTILLFFLANHFWSAEKNWLFYGLAIYFSLSLSEDLVSLTYHLIRKLK